MGMKYFQEIKEKRKNWVYILLKLIVCGNRFCKYKNIVWRNVNRKIYVYRN